MNFYVYTPVLIYNESTEKNLCLPIFFSCTRYSLQPPLKPLLSIVEDLVEVFLIIFRCFITLKTSAITSATRCSPCSESNPSTILLGFVHHVEDGIEEGMKDPVSQ